jgi:hypothetical protein
MSDIYAGLNLGFRPSPSLFPMATEKLLLSRVKGTWRRDVLTMAIEEDRLNEVAPFFTRTALDDDDRRARSAVHPAFMGGEYLPDFEDDEVEVARLELESVTGDVISVRLRRDSEGYHYRVTDEYDGECLAEPTSVTVDKPFTLYEFGKFVCRVSCLSDIVELHEFSDASSAKSFVCGSSTFYPEFGEFVSRAIANLFAD